MGCIVTKAHSEQSTANANPSTVGLFKRFFVKQLEISVERDITYQS